jgi:hypothetical protein
LDYKYHAVALRFQIAEGLSEGSTAEATPIQIVDTAVECTLNGGGWYTEAGGHSDRAGCEASAAQRPLFHSSNVPSFQPGRLESRLRVGLPALQTFEKRTIHPRLLEFLPAS